MVKSLRRRAILGVFVCGMLAPTVGCQNTQLSAAKFAEGFIRAKVEKERLIGETCAAFTTEDGSSKTAALLRDIQQAKRHDLNVLARAICDNTACPVDDATLTIQLQASARSNALMRAVLREVDKQAKSPEDLAHATARISTDAQMMAQILFQMNVARASVFVALKLGDTTQNLADKLADSFGALGGFARPVLEAVTSEIVAATMDQTFSLVESGFHVPRANFTEEACAIYKRSEPRANVAAFVLERAILRYAPKDKLDVLINQGITVDCANLNQWIPSAPLDESVCERIRLAVETKATVNVKSADNSPATSEQALQKLVKPVPPAPDSPDIEAFLTMEADALRKSADACAQAYPNDREGACTLDRVLPVASDAYARAIANQASVSMEQLHFDDMEQRLAAIENELVRTTERLVTDEQRMQKHESDQEKLRDLLEAQEKRLNRLELDLAQHQRLVDTVVAQDAALRQLSGQMADLALVAYREKCRKKHDDTLATRLHVAQKWGFPPNVCSTPDSLQPLTANGMQIRPADFCRADLPITIDFTFRFDTQIAVGKDKKCDSEVRCQDPHYRGLCDAIQRIADELSAEDFQLGASNSRAPYRFIGHASVLGVNACENAGRDGAKEMAQRGIVGLGEDSFQNGLSYLRAKTSAEEFGKLVTSKTAAFIIGKHTDLVAAGTTHVTGIGNPARPSQQEAYQREFQRVAMEIRAPRLVFTVHDCLNSR